MKLVRSCCFEIKINIVRVYCNLSFELFFRHIFFLSSVNKILLKVTYKSHNQSLKSAPLHVVIKREARVGQFRLDNSPNYQELG